MITSESASSDSSAVLLLFHPHAVSLSPPVYSMVGCTSLSHDENCSKMVAMEAFPHRTSRSSQPFKYSKLLSDIAGAFQIVLMVRLYNFVVIRE